jgi:hypothetical protein
MQEVTAQTEDAPEVHSGPAPTPRKIQKERFFCVKVAPARDKNDIPVPVVQVGSKAFKGQRLQLKRGSWVPAREGEVSVLENSKYMVWQNIQGEDRKVGTERIRFPLEGKIEITEEGYKVLRKKALVGKGAGKDGDITEAEIQQYRV